MEKGNRREYKLAAELFLCTVKIKRNKMITIINLTPHAIVCGNNN